MTVRWCRVYCAPGVKVLWGGRLTRPTPPPGFDEGEIMTHYPLIFTVRDTVSGDGFLAGVTLSGRALMVHEQDDGKWWIYGVRPGALAETGNTPQETFSRFRNSYKTVLFDIAEEVSNFEEFKQEVERFYYEPDEEEERRWMAAFLALRSGEVVPEPPFFSELPKEPPEKRPTQIAVERLDKANSRYTTTDNVPDFFAFAAAA